MENKERKDRLEQELRFLKESLEAGVISQDEYNKGESRIKSKLQEIESQAKVVVEEEEKKEEGFTDVEEVIPKGEEPMGGAVEEEAEKAQIWAEKERKRAAPKKPRARKKKIKVIAEKEEKKEESLEEKRGEEAAEKIEIGKKEEEARLEPKKEKAEKKSKERIEEEKIVIEEPSKQETGKSRAWAWGAVILIIIISFAFYAGGQGIFGWEKIKSIFVEPGGSLFESSKCAADSDCQKEKMIGTCENIGTKKTKCEFKEDANVKIAVLNDEACKVCDTSRMKSVILEVFPNADFTEVSINSEEGNKIASANEIKAVPAYLFGESVEGAARFEKFKRALDKREDGYLLLNTASGANYFYSRKMLPARLDAYYLKEQEGRVNGNIQPFLALFGDKIIFKGNVVEPKNAGEEVKELAITSYPMFLINNQIKLGGFHSPEALKREFCSFNGLEECSAVLPNVLR